MAKQEPNHPSEDRTGRFPLDALLRRNGWRIWKRPKRGEPIWEKDGERMPFSRAVNTLDRNDVADAEYQQELADLDYE